MVTFAITKNKIWDFSLIGTVLLCEERLTLTPKQYRELEATLVRLASSRVAEFQAKPSKSHLKAMQENLKF